MTKKKQLPRVDIYTDGACSGNPGVGGWAAILIFGKHEKEVIGSEGHTTNNRMELTAVIEGMNQLKVPCDVDVYSDSSYVINGFTQNWLANWKRRGWKNSAGQPVSNQDLWQQLDKLAQSHQVRWNKVKGHSDNEYNNRCDQLAVDAVNRYKQEHGYEK